MCSVPRKEFQWPTSGRGHSTFMELSTVQCDSKAEVGERIIEDVWRNLQTGEEAEQVGREQVIKGLVFHATELRFYPVS